MSELSSLGASVLKKKPESDSSSSNHISSTKKDKKKKEKEKEKDDQKKSTPNEKRSGKNLTLTEAPAATGARNSRSVPLLPTVTDSAAVSEGIH